MEAEWEAIDLMVALFMKRFLGESFIGAVSRVTKFGFFVRLLDYFVEGLVLLEDAKDDYYIFDEKNLKLRGRRTGKIIKIGTEMRVTVAKVDIMERKVYFVPG
jgi:ribonuclease R